MHKLIVNKEKIIVIVLILLIYFTLLTLISFVRAPLESKAVGESIVGYQDFAVLAEENRAWADADGLHLRDTESTGKVFSAVISLQDIQQIMVRFSVDCSEEYAGTTALHVDLCTEGYDTDEQEFIVTIEGGRNEVSQIIDKGMGAPNEVQFRIFCLDPVQCDISNLNVQVIKEVAHGGKLICVIIIAVLLLLLLMVEAIAKGGTDKGQGKRIFAHNSGPVDKGGEYVRSS